MCESLIWYVRVCTIWCIILYIIYICCIILLNAECGIDLAVTLMKSPLGVALIQQWYYECRCRVMRQSSSDTHDITTGLCVIPWIKFITSQLVKIYGLTVKNWKNIWVPLIRRGSFMVCLGLLCSTFSGSLYVSQINRYSSTNLL